MTFLSLESPEKRHMLFIDDRPCHARRPCSFNDALLARADILPILVRFPQTFASFSAAYCERTRHLPAFYVDPAHTVEAEARRLQAWCAELGLQPDCFCNMSEPQQEYGHRLAELIGLPHLPAATTRALRHKPTMKAWLRAGGLQTADDCELHTQADIDRFTAAHGFPLVLKPTDGWGTLNTHLIERHADLQRHRSLIEQHDMMLETYICDEEIMCCALLQHGEVLDTFISSMPTSPLAIAGGDTMSANISMGPCALPFDFDAITQRIVDAFGLRDGYLHMEWFVDPSSGRVRIGELALRYPGCEIGKNHGLAHGFDLCAATIDLYLGRRVKLDYAPARCVGDLLLPYRAGRVVAHTSARELLSLPGVLEVHLGVELGEVLPPVPSSSFNCSGWVFVEGRVPAEVESRMRAVLDRYRLTTQPAQWAH